MPRPHLAERGVRVDAVAPGVIATPINPEKPDDSESPARKGLGEVVVAVRPASSSTPLWSTVMAGGSPRGTLGDLELWPGRRFLLLEVRAGPENPEPNDAQAYQLWYKLRLPDGGSGWVQAAVTSGFETGADGRPSSQRGFRFPPCGCYTMTSDLLLLKWSGSEVCHCIQSERCVPLIMPTAEEPRSLLVSLRGGTSLGLDVDLSNNSVLVTVSRSVNDGIVGVGAVLVVPLVV